MSETPNGNILGNINKEHGYTPNRDYQKKHIASSAPKWIFSRWRYKKTSTTKNAEKVRIQLKALFRELAKNHNYNGRATLCQSTILTLVENVPGLLGERIFKLFDKDGNEKISFDEFYSGMCILYGGNEEKKMRLLFDLYDLDGNGLIEREELWALLYNLPEELWCPSKYNQNELSNGTNGTIKYRLSDGEKRDLVSSLVHQVFQSIENHKELKNEYSYLHEINYEEFLTASQIIPQLTNLLKVFEEHSIKALFCAHLHQDSSSKLNLGMERKTFSGASNDCSPYSSPPATNTSLIPGDNTIRNKSYNGIVTSMVTRSDTSGWLYKRGKRFNKLHKRYFVLQSPVLYWFHKLNDNTSKNAIYLSGCDVVPHVRNSDEENTLWGFDIKDTNGLTIKTLYAESKNMRDIWTKALRRILHVPCFHDEYSIYQDAVVGRGRYSTVKITQHRNSGELYAVKIIKKTDDINWRDMMRNEIEILKVLDHPNLIRFQESFENHTYIYIIAELLPYGSIADLLSFSKQYFSFEPDSTPIPIKLVKLTVLSVLKGVEHLHAKGIVHRDIKPANLMILMNPESVSIQRKDIISGYPTIGGNILLKNYDRDEFEKLCDDIKGIKIADMGLARFLGPHWSATERVGTLPYAAPEVLLGVDYDKSVDLWSIGVLAFELLTSGQLPFVGNHDADIFGSIVQCQWSIPFKNLSSLQDPIAKDFIMRLLCPRSKRMSCSEAMLHPFLCNSNSE